MCACWNIHPTTIDSIYNETNRTIQKHFRCRNRISFWTRTAHILNVLSSMVTPWTTSQISKTGVGGYSPTILRPPNLKDWSDKVRLTPPQELGNILSAPHEFVWTAVGFCVPLWRSCASPLSISTNTSRLRGIAKHNDSSNKTGVPFIVRGWRYYYGQVTLNSTCTP
jgi:hypothetical protein